MKNIRLFPVFFLSAFLFLALNQAVAGTLTSSVNRANIYDNETLALTVQYDSNVDGEEPEIALLKQQFDIVSQNKSSSFQIINGRSSRSTTWYYELLPKQTGTLLIPSFTINGDFSEAMTVAVTPAPKATAKKQNSIYSETSIDLATVYVQQQAVITWRLASKMDISDVALAPPQIADTLLQDLGNHEYQRADSDGNIEHVIEQRYALFPQKSGALKIPAQQFQVTVHAMRRSTMGIIHQGSNTIRIMTDAQTLHVKPAEASSQQTEWLPAQQVDITQDIYSSAKNNNSQANRYTVGEAFTRVVRVQAEGISAEQLPPVNMSLAGCKVYSEKPRLKNNTSDQGVTGIREEQVAIICTQPGAITLPDITLPWYNTQTHEWRKATLPAQTIDVQDNGSGNTKAATAPPTSNSTTISPTQNAVTRTQTDTQANTQADKLVNRITRYTTHRYFWPVAAMTVLILWIATVCLALKIVQRRKLIAPESQAAAAAITSDPEHQQPVATPITLASAIALHDMPALYREVIRWAKQRWPDEHTINIATIARHIGDAELQHQLELLERHLLGNGPAPDKPELISSTLARTEKQKTVKAEKSDRHQLDELYR